MKTSSIPFSTRRAVNPVLTDPLIFDDEEEARDAFLTPVGRQMERYMPLASALVAGTLLLAAWLTPKLQGPQALEHLLLLLAFVIAGVPGLRAAWESLLEARIDVDVLMILGAGLAAIIGQPIEGALLLFLFALSGALEQEATRRTQHAIRSLRDLNPTFAIVIGDDGRHARVATTQVAVGDRVLVRPGDRVPVDGAVREGESSVDEAPITGESMPRSKLEGEPVYAGSINGSGTLVVEATRPAGDTQLAKIIRLVTEAKGRQARIERLFDRISPTYAACVIGAAFTLALLGPIWLDWRESTRRAIALLIVASPCALIIATPIAYLSAIAAAARRGVLIKGGVYLEVLARCRAVVFDKTGTLTSGHPRVAEVIPDGLGERDALRVAAALEASSSHPLAAAIHAAARERGLEPGEARQVEMFAGQGVRGHIGSEPVAIGKPEFTASLLTDGSAAELLASADRMSAGGRTVALVVRNGHGAVLAFEDPLRADAGEMVRALRSSGITRIVMLTGDRAQVAARTAEALGLDGCASDLLPEQKIHEAERIRGLGGPVAAVGDGVNDAPLLARADVGIAMAGIGSDAALEAAPIVLMNNTLERLAWLFSHARRTAGIVRQNLTLAIAVIVVLSGVAVLGKVDLPVAVIAHEGSTLLVAANALRLLRGSPAAQ